MIVTIKRSGGFSGIAQTKTLNTNNLPQDRAVEIERFVSDLLHCRPIAKNSKIRDGFQYELDVDGRTVMLGCESGINQVFADI